MCEPSLQSSGTIISDVFVLFHVHECAACKYLCAPCVWLESGDQNHVMFVSYHVSARNWGPLQMQQVLLIAEPSLHNPCMIISAPH